MDIPVVLGDFRGAAPHDQALSAFIEDLGRAVEDNFIDDGLSDVL